MCDSVNTTPLQQYLCNKQLAPAWKNQIIIGHNEIMIYGGTPDMSPSFWKTWTEAKKYKWRAALAVVLFSVDQVTKNDDKDIGIISIGLNVDGPAGIPMAKRFFNKKHLKNSRIRPICLPIENTLPRHKWIFQKLIAVGWGYQYNERGTPGNFYSSCMTNQAGPIGARFYNCDMKNAEMKCNKQSDPPGYDPGKCKEYHEKLMSFKNELDDHIQEKLDEVDVIYVTNKNGETTTCYPPASMTSNGWCRVKKPKTGLLSGLFSSFRGQADWGICSPSCSKVCNR